MLIIKIIKVPLFQQLFKQCPSSLLWRCPIKGLYKIIIFSQSNELALHSRAHRRLKLNKCLTCTDILNSIKRYGIPTSQEGRHIYICSFSFRWPWPWYKVTVGWQRQNKSAWIISTIKEAISVKLATTLGHFVRDLDFENLYFAWPTRFYFSRCCEPNTCYSIPSEWTFSRDYNSVVGWWHKWADSLSLSQLPSRGKDPYLSRTFPGSVNQVHNIWNSNKYTSSL